MINSLYCKAQGIKEPLETSLKPITLNPFKVRNAVLQTARQKPIHITLYWATAQIGFCEDNSLKAQYLSGDKNQRLRFQLAPSLVPYTKLCLDIADTPGCFMINELSIFDASSIQQWCWNFDTSQFSEVGELQFFKAESDQKGICMLSTGYDPQFVLNLPEVVLTQISAGGELLVNISGYE